MRWSLITSLFLHVAILVATFVVMPNPDEFKVQDQEMIPVDIVSVEDFSKRMAMTKAPEAPKKVEKPKPKPQEIVKETKPAPEVAPEIKTAAREPSKSEPPPEPKKEEPKKEEPKKAEEPKPEDPLKDLIKETVDDTPLPKKEEPKKEEPKKAEAKPEKKPDKKKVEKKKPEFDPEAIEQLLLDKTDGKNTAPQRPSQETGEQQQAAFNMSGEDEQLAATMLDKLIQKLSQCWASPAGAREAQIIVRIRFQLDQQGNVVGLPSVISAGGDALSQSTARSAVSAIMDCQSYDFLPADRYDLWKEITLDFDPRMMS